MPNVLVVDDEPAIRRALSRLLAAKGYSVAEAGSAFEGVARVSKGGIDAVLCDIMMPGATGFEFYDEMLTHAPQLAKRVVFLTAAATEPDNQAAAEARGSPLLSKLYDLDLAIDAVGVALLPRG